MGDHFNFLQYLNNLVCVQSCLLFSLPKKNSLNYIKKESNEKGVFTATFPFFFDCSFQIFSTVFLPQCFASKVE